MVVSGGMGCVCPLRKPKVSTYLSENHLLMTGVCCYIWANRIILHKPQTKRGISYETELVARCMHDNITFFY